MLRISRQITPAFQPGGFRAISRWSSAANTTGKRYPFTESNHESPIAARRRNQEIKRRVRRDAEIRREKIKTRAILNAPFSTLLKNLCDPPRLCVLCVKEFAQDAKTSTVRHTNEGKGKAKKVNLRPPLPHQNSSRRAGIRAIRGSFFVTVHDRRPC